MPGGRRREVAPAGEADVLCAPSLGGESVGMVLTEAFDPGPRWWPPTSRATATSRGTPGQRARAVGDAVALGDLRAAGLRSRQADANGTPLASAPTASRGERGAARSPRSTRCAERATGRTRSTQRGAARGLPPTEPGPRVGPQRLPSLSRKDPTAGRRRAARTARGCWWPPASMQAPALPS